MPVPVPDRAPVALVTGGSSGIGAAVAARLRRRGLTVYATARDTARLRELTAMGVVPVELDLTDEDSTRSAIDLVRQRSDRLDVLVNNAGYGLPGVVEELPLDEVRGQFEANVFGPLRLVQLVLPEMRARGEGRIVMMSSILGRASPPGAGAYHASKHAIEAFTDSLRLEAAPYGIRVALVEPGPVRTPFAAAVVARLDKADGIHRAFHQDLANWYRATFGLGPPNLLARFAVTPEAVARVVERAVRARHPRARYPVGPLARSFLLLRRVLPDRLFDEFVRAQFPAPGRA